MTTEKANDGHIGHLQNDDQLEHENSLKQQNSWGHRLAWSRLVDLGSIDSGSNPGGPTISFLDLTLNRLLQIKLDDS